MSAKKKAAKKAIKKKAAKPSRWPKKEIIKKASPKKAAKKAVTKKTAKKTATKAQVKKPARKPNAAFMAPLSPSPALADVIGSKSLPRTEIVKKIWQYIKTNKLQDKQNKRMINADPKLKTLFNGKSQISMFELAKVVSKHTK